MQIYLASSWRNAHQPYILAALRAAGHEVYDFRNPAPGNDGFRWSDIDPDWQNWTPEQYHAALNHPIAERGFRFDMTALRDCDACVLVLPCGRSAHLELGYAVGAGKKTYVLQFEPQEPELMVKMCTGIFSSLPALIEALKEKKDGKTGGLWRKRGTVPKGGKYLVLRRDGTVPEWPGFVIGARDPAAPAALRAYSEEARRIGFDSRYVEDVWDLASDFELYRASHGDGDPTAPPHRKDDPEIIAKMTNGGM